MLNLDKTIKHLKKMLKKEEDCMDSLDVAVEMFGDNLTKIMAKDKPENIEALKSAIFILSILQTNTEKRNKNESTKSDDT